MRCTQYANERSVISLCFRREFILIRKYQVWQILIIKWTLFAREKQLVSKFS